MIDKFDLKEICEVHLKPFIILHEVFFEKRIQFYVIFEIHKQLFGRSNRIEMYTIKCFRTSLIWIFPGTVQKN